MEMYPGIFIVTSINGRSTLQNIDRISKVIKLSYPDDPWPYEGNLVSQITQEQIDTFFQNYHWSKSEKSKMVIQGVEYRDRNADHSRGFLVVTYREGKKGPLFTFEFSDTSTQLIGLRETGVTTSDIWHDYLFGETVRPWLDKHKLQLSIKVPNTPCISGSANSTIGSDSKGQETVK